jgi:parvulin-like peptidyl-prolyl isomerase
MTSANPPRNIAAALLVCLCPAAAQAQANKPPAPKAATAQPSAPAAQAGDQDIVARIGQREVTMGEVRAQLAALGPRERAAVAADPALLAQAVRRYLTDELVLSAALARKWDQRPEVAAQLERARRAALADSFLDAMSQPPESYPSDTEVQALYDANKSSFVMPRQFQIAQLFVAAPDKASEEAARGRLDAALARIKAQGGDLKALRPEDLAKDKGDRVDEFGWVPENRVKPEIREQVFSLAKGAVSAPLKLADGWHVLKLIDTKPASILPLEEVRAQLVQRLRQERAAQLRTAVIQDLARQNPAAINELALSKALPASQETQRN